MCSPGLALMGANAVMGAASAYNNAKADRSALDLQAQAAMVNAGLARHQASMALYQGQATEQQSDLRTAQVKSSQRTAMAANGLNLASGTPTNVLTSTDMTGAHDAAVIADNARREAWSYNVQATNDTNNASLLSWAKSQISPMKSALTSLLSSGGTVANPMMNYLKAGGGGSGYSVNSASVPGAGDDVGAWGAAGAGSVA